MGTSTLLDIIGSMIIGGLLILMALRLNVSAKEYSSAYYASYLLQSNLLTLVVMIEDDFKRIGYCKNPKLLTTADAIAVADSNRISFRTDINNTGNVNTITYWAGLTSELTSTDNPKDFYLYRQVDNNTPTQWNLGLTKFLIRYWDNQNTPDSMSYAYAMASPGAIRVTDVSIKLESPFKSQQQYMMDTSEYQLFWRELRMTAAAFKYPRSR
jgi:hypothetical protein